MVAYSRIYLGRHYLGDVLVGAVVGTLFAMLAWWGYKYWMRRDLMRKEERGKI